MSSVNWSGSPKNCVTMSKLVRKCREKQVNCSVYKKMLSVCQKKIYKKRHRIYYGKKIIPSER